MMTHAQMMNGCHFTRSITYFDWLVQNINKRICIMSAYFTINPFTAGGAERRPLGRPQMSPFADISNYSFFFFK